MSLQYFMIVGKNDTPLFETELSGNSKQKDDARQYILQFVLHASLDVVDEVVWTTQAMNLKLVDRYNDMYVAAYNTAGNVRLLLLTDQKGGEEGIKMFFQEVHEVYLRACLNPFHSTTAPIKSPAFLQKLSELGRSGVQKSPSAHEAGPGALLAQWLSLSAARPR